MDGVNLDEQSFDKLVQSLMKYDYNTYVHSVKVMRVSMYIANLSMVGRKNTEEIRIGALLHDIGNLRVSKEILSKPQSELSSVEKAIVHNSVTSGVTIASTVTNNVRILSIIGLHHLNENGTGYKALAPKYELRYDNLVKIVHIAEMVCTYLDNRGTECRRITLLEDIERFIGRERNELTTSQLQQICYRNVSSILDEYKKNDSNY